MRFTHDRRGQSVVVGTVILFGFLILALSLYQVQVVPTENSNVEFEHSQQVKGEFLDLRNSLLSASRIGDGRSTSLKLGTRYPQRTFSLNPPQAAGELSTSEPRELRIENVTVDDGGNVGAYWTNRTATDDAIDFDTRSLRYSPGYNEFRKGPDLLYEHSLVVAEFDDTALGRSGQTAVDGDRNRIRLTALDGEVDEFGVERTSLDPETLSQSRRSVTLNSTGSDPIVLELPTDVSTDRAGDLEQQWSDRLGANVEGVSVAGGTIRIELNGTDAYRLELGKVGVGAGATAPDESGGYIKKVSSNNGVAEVRDRFNNPVEGAEVTVVDTSDGSVLSTRTTDEDGRVEYVPNDPPEDVEMRINANDDSWESALFEDLSAADQAGESNRTFDVTWIENEPVNVTEGTSEELDVTIADRKTGEPIRSSIVDYSFSPLQDNGLPQLQPDSSSQNDGFDTATFSQEDAEVGDQFYVYAAAGDDVDRVLVQIIASGTGSMADRTTLTGPAPINGNDGIEFGLETSGTDDVRITDIAVDSADATNFNPSSVADQDGQGGTFRVSGGTTLRDDSITIGETVSLNNDLEISGGDAADVELGQFEDDDGSTGNMNQADVQLTFSFADGSTATYTLNVSN